MKRRAILLVMDSVGIGALPDAAFYGDQGAHTLGNIYQHRGYLNIPNLYALGLANIENSRLPAWEKPIQGAYGRAMELTAAKDTTSGHWELAGLPLQTPLQTYPNGFPADLISRFEKRIGRGTLCNKPASGTTVIQEFGDEHIKTGKPIVYTSADSVFQIAAHEEVIPLPELYRICAAARDMLVGDYLVGRVIARPFLGSSGQYIRTQNRKDYSIDPPGDTILDALSKMGFQTVGIGKIEDIFSHRGISVADHTRNNPDSIQAAIRFMQQETFDFMFVNLVDFDMLHGHRNDVEGYALALEAFDASLPEILNSLREDDLLIITADHGCDPTTSSTDHSREFIPLLVTGSKIRKNVSIGTRNSFADVGATIFAYLTGKVWPQGNSFLEEILNGK